MIVIECLEVSCRQYNRNEVMVDSGIDANVYTMVTYIGEASPEANSQ